jgi:tripartite-type tricarboxylate transporter receptor subunit TctC
MMRMSKLASAGGLFARACTFETHIKYFLVSLALLILAASPAAADDFYNGKTIKLIVGSAPGAGYDAYGRLLARHIRRYLPGQPNVVVTYMPGADGLVAGNHLFNMAERDGTVFGTFNRYTVTMPLLGNANAKFKANEFNWIGTATSYADDSYVLIVRAGVPHRTIDDLRNPTLPLHIGSVDTDVPQILKEALGLSYKIITGYKGKQELDIAMERGEADGQTLGWSSLASRHQHWVKNSMVRPVIQFGRIERLPALEDVPTARELAKTSDDRALIEFAELPLLMARPFAAPPGTPPERVAVLRKAFLQAVNDPDYLAEATKQKLEQTPKSGEEVQALVAGLDKASPAVIARYKGLLGSRLSGGG